MTAAELRERAKQEIAELGPRPANPREAEMCIEERRGAAVLLAGLAEWDRVLLKRAAFEVAHEWANRDARELLLDDVAHCD
jgi:hypothetical protein